MNIFLYIVVGILAILLLRKHSVKYGNGFSIDNMIKSQEIKIQQYKDCKNNLGESLGKGCVVTASIIELLMYVLLIFLAIKGVSAL